MASREEIIAFMDDAFPDSPFSIEAVAPNSAIIRRPVTDKDLRPGGTVSGPTMMGLADTAFYVAIHATLGITPQAVTSNLNIHFLRRPAADKAILATCTLIKVGRSLAVGQVILQSEGTDEPIAHVVGSYALPANARAPGVGQRV